VLLRRAGKLVFLDLHDWTGRIQVAIGMKQVGEKNWELTQQFDLGDLIGIDGELKRTHVGELTIATQLAVSFGVQRIEGNIDLGDAVRAKLVGEGSE